MAEGLLRKAARDAGIEAHAVSAGVSVFAPEPASENAVKAASELGADISGHRARLVNSELLGAAGAVYCMTGAHLAMLKSMYPQYAFKLRTLDPDGDVTDPFGGGGEDYRRVAARINALVAGLVSNGR
ncbi:MAG: low molecular weight protein arginine phosphatase [Oscillospiraceae bacterium]|nr:low molecular weight protein arginine phosphatase [Oscillospiraceae bacterium]